MNKILKGIYINSPFFLKKIFANGEALRRNIYRRSGEYNQYYKNININNILAGVNNDDQVEKLNMLLSYVNKHIPFYRENSNLNQLNIIDDFSKIPLINKELMRNDINSFINEKFVDQFWKGRTSGSTGSPFSYFRDRKSMQYEYALYDKLYEFIVGHQNYTKARISGVNIVKADCKNPPYWYFLKVFNQLQCSAYHIDSKTYKQYLEAFDKYKVELGTGYASSWLFLAQYILSENVKPPKLKAIVTDSEGVSNKEKLQIERAFNCPVYQTYGLGEVGMVAVQCKNNHYHIFTDRCFVEVVNEKGDALSDGEIGEITVTDLHSFKSPFIRYRTGDTGALGFEDCKCGAKGPYIKELCGRVDDYVITREGKRIGRLSHIAKPAKGVLGMQLIQNELGSLDINVIPSESFEPDSMNEVIATAKDYLTDMNINWRIVDNLEKTSSGKIRYVIRKF